MQVHLDTIYKILDQHKILTKQQQEAKLKEFINTSIENAIKNSTIHTPERKPLKDNWLLNEILNISTMIGTTLIIFQAEKNM